MGRGAQVTEVAHIAAAGGADSYQAAIDHSFCTKPPSPVERQAAIHNLQDDSGLIWYETTLAGPSVYDPERRDDPRFRNDTFRNASAVDMFRAIGLHKL